MTDSFWKAAEPIIQITERHPFLVAMVNGTLSLPSFMYYAVQDALYLKNFGDCLIILSKKKEAFQKDSKCLIELARKAEEAKMWLHTSFFKKWQIDTTGIDEKPHTLLYTSYLLRVVSRDYEEGLAVLLPCFWVYMHVGKCMLNMREELSGSVQRCPLFDDWIDMYAGEDYENYVCYYIRLVDSIARHASNKKLNLMSKHFLMSCKLEHMFLDQALSLMQWPCIGEENLE